MAERDVTYEAVLEVDGAVVRATFPTLAAAKAWVLAQATITKVVRQAVPGAVRRGERPEGA